MTGAALPDSGVPAGAAPAVARFALLVVSYGSSALLERNLAPLPVPEGGTVVVVDCRTDAVERDRVRELAARHGWEAVLLDRNAGFGGGMNAGAARALELGARVLVALNPDARIRPDALESLVAAAEADPWSIASPTILDAGGRVWFGGAALDLGTGETRGAARAGEIPRGRRVAWATGACFALSARLWQRLDGFDEDYFLYWEDVDLSHRALAAGARLVQLDDTIEHDQGGTHAGRREGPARSELYYYFNIRNRMLFAAKRLAADDVRRWSRSAPRAALSVVLRGGRRQLLSSAEPWRGGLRGLRDGRRIARGAVLERVGEG